MNAQSLLDLDARLSKQMRIAEKPGSLRTVAAILAHSGDSWFWGLGLAALWLLGNPEWKTWALKILISIFFLAVVVLITKFAVRRKRPEGEWGAIYRTTDPHSFPSGHAARSVLLAVLVLGWGPAAAAPLMIIWAPLVALARVAMGVHFLSDILAGGIIGIIAGVLSLNFVG
jgi:undecaprenyl-diphosphatase